MSRSALTFSLVFHAGMLAVLGWSSQRDASHAVSSSGVGMSLLVEDAGLVGEKAPERSEPVLAAPPESFAPPVPEIDLRPSPAAMVEITPPVITTAATIPPTLPTAIPEKRSGKSGTRKAVAAASKAVTGDTRKGGSGGGLSGGNGGLGYVPPQFLLRYKPPYPEAARPSRLEGTVLLLVSVDTAGRVTDATLRQSCGHAILDRAALVTVKSWRFSPARQWDQAIAATVEVPIRFTFSG